MRLPFSTALIATLAGAGVYFYTQVVLPCPIPMTYSLGNIDERFGLDEEETLNVIADAVSVWEDKIGKDLFIPVTEGGDISFNFIFDERQSLEIAENTFASRLAEGKSANDAFTAAYDELTEKYEKASSAYEVKKAAYETAQNKYNEIVSDYNQSGGAPESEYNRLEEERKRLNKQASQLEKDINILNQYVEDLNELSSKGKEMIENYNSQVATYNAKFGDIHEFTQGDYKSGEINIYTFENRNELKAVLLHELGHALSLQHVNDEISIMYYLMDKQRDNPTLTEVDVAEYNRVCENRTWWQTLINFVRSI